MMAHLRSNDYRKQNPKVLICPSRNADGAELEGVRTRHGATMCNRRLPNYGSSGSWKVVRLRLSQMISHSHDFLSTR